MHWQLPPQPGHPQTLGVLPCQPHFGLQIEKGSFLFESVIWVCKEHGCRGEAAGRHLAQGRLSPSLSKLTLGCGIASCRGGPGHTARCPQPPGSARPPCSRRHPPSAYASSETLTLAPHWVEVPSTARSRRDGSAQTVWL